MGLFSDTKKYRFSLIANNTPFSFEEFRDAFLSFIVSEECKSCLNTKGIAIEGAIVLDDMQDEKFENSLQSTNAITPYGALDVGISDKGENQGYAVEIVTLEITLTLKKADKDFTKEFYSSLFAYINEKFNPGNAKKNMFVTSKSNTLGV